MEWPSKGIIACKFGFSNSSMDLFRNVTDAAFKLKQFDGIIEIIMAYSLVLSRRSTDVSLDKAELIGIWLESIIFGCEALSFVYTIHLLHGMKRNRVLLFNFAALITMFALNTIHVGSNLRRILNAFVSTPDDPSPNAEAYLADFAGFLYRFKNILIIVQSFILDILLIYRTYIIWDEKLLIILLPLSGSFAYLIAGIGAIRAFAVQEDDAIFTESALRKWVSATLSITLMTKLICIVLVLAGALIPRQSSSWQAFSRRSRFKGWAYKTLLMIIETGGIAFLGALILLPTYLTRDNAQETLFNMLSPLTGEAFVLIHLAGLLGMIPSNSGPSSRIRRYGSGNKSSTPTHAADTKRGESSTNAMFHFKKSLPGSSDEYLSDEISTKVIPVAPEPTSVPKAIQTAPLQLLGSLTHNSKAVERDINNHSQHRHPFAASSPVHVSP